MPKLKKTVQDQKTPVIISTNMSSVKKQKKEAKKLMNSLRKNNSKKLDASNEIAENMFTSKQNNKKKYGFKNKFDLNDKKSNIPTKMDADSKIKHKIKNELDINNTERSDFLAGCTKDDEKTSEVFQKIHSNTNRKAECKRRNIKRKPVMNLEYINREVARGDRKERNKELQISTKESIDFEHKKIKIKKLTKITEKKMKLMSAKVEVQQIKAEEILKLNKHMIKIKQLEEMLTKILQMKQSLKDKVMTQLVTRFRSINEILYNNNSSQSKYYFKQNPEAFKAYQVGYKWQLEQWMVNPLDIIISSIMKMPTDNIIADFGCGEARLAASVPHTVHSFDFIVLNDRVKSCDVTHTPLQMNSVDIVIFCLSLMGSNLHDYIAEANRVLKNNGILKIAEVGSRFENVKDFIRVLRNYGFKNTWKDLSHNLFYFMDFKKKKDINIKKETLPPITLQPYLSKKR